jgi:AraC family transcriptional regulator of adaptative response / DNA-3-methyladenine glycosylase II
LRHDDFRPIRALIIRSENRERRPREGSSFQFVELDRKTCYRVLLARDARHDGRFFTCVKSTGIYCRPVCPARTPKLENCLFVPTAAAAQEAGFRPCLRCRPERSPDLWPRNAGSATVSRALTLIERGALDEADVEALAERLGVGARQLRRLFHQHVGASPINVAQTRRVLLAKQLIHDSTLSMTEVALASGFSSLRRFNETFKDLYGRPPSALRRRGVASARGSTVELYLPYREPYDFPRLLAFLAGRAITGVEQVTAQRYQRVIEVAGGVGAITVSDCRERSALRVQVRLSQLGALPSVIARVRHVFDLGSDPRIIARELARDPLLAPLVAKRPGLRVPGAWDGFELAVRGVLGQQISVRAATQLAGKLVASLGKPLEAGWREFGLTHAFPAPELFALEKLAALGMPRARAAALAGLAAALCEDRRLFDTGQDLERAVARLTALPGIGAWTAHYIALRALAQSDAFPTGDIGLLRALAQDGARLTPKALLARAEAWRPWRAYAVLHLWTEDAERQNARVKVTVRGSRREKLDALAS